LLDKHARSFPNGILAEERAAERVLALCALDRMADARAAASAFLRAHPHSPLAARVKSSCAGEGQ
jgi:RNA polymerase sigma-70 factor (ECF subfamily)